MTKPLPRAMRRQLEEAQVLQDQMFQVPEVPAETPSEPQEPAATPPVEPVSEDPKWEQRYRTLQGQFNTVVPQLQAQLAELKAKVEQAPAATAPVAPAPVERLVTDKDTEEFGADMLDLIARRAKEISREENQALFARISELEAKLQEANGVLGRVSEHQVQTEQERFTSELSRAVPEWESINTSQGFLDWLAEEDVFSGVARQQLLTSAGEKLDLKRVVAIFRQYQATLPAAPVAPQADTLQQQVTPARSANAAPAPTANPQVKIWTAVEWQRTYESLRRMPQGPDRVAIEQELNLAMAQGRIQP